MTESQATRTSAVRNFREANEKIARTAGGLVFEGDPVPLLCECADVECFELVHLPLDEYGHVRSNPRWFLNVPGHQSARHGGATVIERHDRYWIVENEGHAGGCHRAPRA